ncbi:uncharacterized protein [Clytia hemisphaerica]|uniref:uncharacterized protein n=1 Tax=Clytia hemisphaerica TaxID=252671 RepID=UPI0034D467ED
MAAYQSSRKFIFEQVKRYKQRYRNAKIYVTGYSLGAAQAVYCALELNLAGYDTYLLTFGSPRPGNKAFADFVNRHLGSKNYRITYGKDLVAHFPSAERYHHVGIEVNFGKGGGYAIRAQFSDDKKHTAYDHSRSNYENLNMQCEH